MSSQIVATTLVRMTVCAETVSPVMASFVKVGMVKL